MRGALMVCATASDAGKSTVVAGLCRLLARRGVKVAPFKAQNMALNSAVTVEGHEIGRAQAAQAQAAGIVAEVAMNPILLKPTSDRSSQVVVTGRPWATLDAAAYQAAKPQLQQAVLDALESLRRRFDVVLCEGAGSPTEINLLDGDLVNLRLAQRARIPAVVVGDIERGGVFASLFGTVELLPADLKPLVRGFIINKFRGDPALLGGAPAELERRLGVPTLGVLPWTAEAEGLDSEDSLALRRGPWSAPPPIAGTAGEGLDVAVIRLPHLANFTDLDPLAVEPGVSLRLVDRPAGLGCPDLVVLPGSKATVKDLAWVRSTGLAEAIVDLVSEQDRPTTVLGICAGYQMLGRTIDDSAGVESDTAGVFEGLGLLQAETTFHQPKITIRRSGVSFGHPVEGYEVHHGVTAPSAPWLQLDGEPEGSSSADGAIFGTSLHGLFEMDGFRRAFLDAVAHRAQRTWTAGGASFEAFRQARFDRLADLIEEHLDLDALENMIAGGATT